RQVIDSRGMVAIHAMVPHFADCRRAHQNAPDGLPSGTHRRTASPSEHRSRPARGRKILGLRVYFRAFEFKRLDLQLEQMRSPKLMIRGRLEGAGNKPTRVLIRSTGDPGPRV